MAGPSKSLSYIKEKFKFKTFHPFIDETYDEIEDDMQGSTLNIEIADCYLVLIKQPKRVTKASLLEMGTTLAHEMVHVRQLAKGQMKFLPNQARIWMGKRYNKRTHYLDQPWELDAFARQEILFRKAIEL